MEDQVCKLNNKKIKIKKLKGRFLKVHGKIYR